MHQTNDQEKLQCTQIKEIVGKEHKRCIRLFKKHKRNISFYKRTQFYVIMYMVKYINIVLSYRYNINIIILPILDYRYNFLNLMLNGLRGLKKIKKIINAFRMHHTEAHSDIFFLKMKRSE